MDTLGTLWMSVLCGIFAIKLLLYLVERSRDAKATQEETEIEEKRQEAIKRIDNLQTLLLTEEVGRAQEIRKMFSKAANAPRANKVTNCKNCGAGLTTSICEYCGTTY